MKHLIMLLLLGGAVYGQPPYLAVIDYAKADSIASLYPAEDIGNLPVLTHRLTSDFDDELQKFRAIYTWVCTHVKNDHAASRKTTAKRRRFAKKEERLRQWNTAYLPKVFMRLVEDRKTNCTGYAYLICQMASLAGMECEIVHGHARTSATDLTINSLPNHSWNAIKIQGQWYLCDATWSAGHIHSIDGVPSFQFEYSDAYFLPHPKLFAMNHYPLDKRWLLMKGGLSFDAFLDGPLIYKGAFENRATPIAPKQFFLEVEKNKPLTFTLLTETVLGEGTVSLVLIKNGTIDTFYPLVVQDGNTAELTHNFESNGRYDVHLFVNEKVVATYVIHVTKNAF